MTWSWAEAHRASVRLRRAELGLQALSTIRPRSVVGIVRSRAPLPVLLLIAARDGLLVEADDGGFALLQRPAIDPPVRSGTHGRRFLRWVDRRWEFVLFGAPPAVCLLASAALALATAFRLAALFLVLAALMWISVFLTCGLLYQLRWLAAFGARETPSGSRAAQSLPAYHWSVPLLHQPDPSRVDDLLRLSTRRLADLIRAGLQDAARDKARVDHADVTETLIVLTRGISTTPARDAASASQRALSRYPDGHDVIVLRSPGRLERPPRRAVIGGGFFVLYLAGLSLAVLAATLLVASAEAEACRPADCDGRPSTYATAFRWILWRLLFVDAPGLAPGTARASLLGWLMSFVGLVGGLVAIVAARQEISRNKETRLKDELFWNDVTGSSRTLILVTAEVERDAVLQAVRKRSGRDPILDQSGERTIYTLWRTSGTELLLAQSGEQGTVAATGMLITARTVIEQCRPDFVILTGICFGLGPDAGQRIGDVVVARRVQNIDHRKVSERDGAEWVIHRGVNVGCSPILLDRFQTGQVTWSDPDVRIHIGTVLTSNTLVNSRPFVERLRADFPDAIAGEMEGTGVHEAATGDIKPDWIMVKGISDWGYDKTEEFQHRAAANAAELVMHVITGGAVSRRHGRAGQEGLA